MANSLIYVGALVTFYGLAIEASHFAGGTVWWKYIEPHGTGHAVEVYYRFGWDRDSGGRYCDDATIKQQTTVAADGVWRIDGADNYDSTNQTTAIKCTVYDSNKDWIYGYNSFRMLIATSRSFSISYTGSSWIPTSGWALTSGSINFNSRSDTGAVNNPPRATNIPIVKLTQGCAKDIVIKYQEDDGDRVTCRYAVAGRNPDECDSACSGGPGSGYNHFTLSETSCSIHYDGGGGAQQLPIALVLEDYPRTTIVLGSSDTVTTSDFLSQTPLQFLVSIESGSSCNVRPTYPSQTIQDNQQITIPSDGVMTSNIYAYASSNSASISQFVVIGPLGMLVSPVTYSGNNLYSSQLTWKPSSRQEETHDVCYYATDSTGNQGKQICFTVDVGDVSNACEVNNGGCSDICTPKGHFRQCDCSIPCWSLDIDGATCAPDMNITCDGEAMSISIAQCASNRTVVAGDPMFHTTQERCQSSSVGNGHVINLNVSTCGVTFAVNPVQVEFAGNLWIWHGVDTGSSVIVRGEYRIVPVACTLSSKNEVSESFMPELPFNNESFPIDVRLKGFGEFSLYFEFYKSSNYSSVIAPSEYPLSVTVNDRFYISIGAIGEPGFTFFTQECSAASSSPAPEDPPLKYTFLKNGCLIDPTLLKYPTSNPMEDRLSMEAFEFKEKLTASRSNAEITLQCRVIICDASNSTSRCFRGCVTSARNKRSIRGRVPRDVDHHDSISPRVPPAVPESPLLDIKGRLILVKELDHPGIPTQNTDTANPLYWILIAIGLAILLVVMIGVYRLFRPRRFNGVNKYPADDNEMTHRGVYVRD